VPAPPRLRPPYEDHPRPARHRSGGILCVRRLQP
jgi:hypothetical protein